MAVGAGCVWHRCIFFTCITVVNSYENAKYGFLCCSESHMSRLLHFCKPQCHEVLSNSTKCEADTTASATHLTGHSPALDRKLHRLQVMDSAASQAVIHGERDLGSAATRAPISASLLLERGWRLKHRASGCWCIVIGEDGLGIKLRFCTQAAKKL